MSLLTFTDLAGLLAQLAVVILILYSYRQLVRRRYLVLLLVIALFLLYNNLSNTLQWAGITEALDPYEDHMEILSAVLWGFFLASFIQARTEDRMRESLQAKETLLREVHHRVKNNLQVISGLLNLQSMYIDESGPREIYRESQNRIKTMALIHEELYQREDLARVDFAEYLANLARNLFASYNIGRGDVALELDLEKASMPLDTAIPCGLIVNELVTNSLKHAFVNGGRGAVGIAFSGSGDDSYNLRVWDTGVGFPPDLDYRCTGSMGMNLVAILTEQLDARVSLGRRDGTSFSISFREYHEARPEKVF